MKVSREEKAVDRAFDELSERDQAAMFLIHSRMNWWGRQIQRLLHIIALLLFLIAYHIGVFQWPSWWTWWPR